MAQINKPNTNFNTVTYTASGSGQSVTGVNFQPDLVWLKIRNTTGSHYLNDSVRGVQKSLYSNESDAETSDNYLASFDSDGFSLGSGNYTSPNTIVSWNWLGANGTASNTDGSITSTVSANTTSGFSIVSWTGTGSNATVGHGLSSAPKMVICKRRDANDSWFTYNENIGSGAFLALSSNIGSTTAGASGLWNNTSPTSSVFTVGTNGGVNASGGTYIAYCFAEKKGFSKFGSYTGNGSLDAPFIYNGFKPAWVMIKRTDTANDWIMFDNKRNTFNVVNTHMYANNNSPDDTSTNYNEVDFLSNGFKLREDNTTINASGGTYIYMAFAENPLVGTNNIPATAR